MTSAVRFVADESRDFAVVRALRGAGYEVVAIAEVEPRAPDAEVLSHGHASGAVILTEDRDFGRLVFAERRSSAGVVFIRFPARERAEMAGAVVALANRLGTDLAELFVTITERGPRVRPLPGV